ncbi:DUF58 domain-containing protein [Halopelagius longus]|uniref:Conserved repeat domain-containing protein n=2 Tax=Halopelagius longus TaxID=1236180 RepID=A0A1H1GH25_9EURY|nr:DUF58 domain-containing protein [Halopelagius longus]SDR12514.1 conserved repeat domain-containing protein [Halopelagius longus]
MNVRRDPRWNAGIVGTLSLVGLGLAYASTELVAAAAVPLAYVFYGLISSLPDGATLELERELDPDAPAPGETTTVTLTVRNAGDSTLTDLRVVDGVPEALAVTEGSPRAALSLAPGDERTVEYCVVGKRGDHAFEDALVRLRSLSGVRVATTELPVGGETTLSCTNALDSRPAPDAAPVRAGSLPADSGGPGIEFHSTREYRPGDPLSRVDWRHLAKTGELTTVEFREQRATRVALVADVRPESRVVARPGHPTAAELCAHAAGRTHRALLAANDDADVTVLGLDAVDVPESVAVGPEGLPWPDGPRAAEAILEVASAVAGAEPRRTGADGDAARTGRYGDASDADAPEWVRDAVPDGGSAGSGSDTAGRTAVEDLAASMDARFPGDASVVLFSPLLDGVPVALCRALGRRGRRVTLLSPDVTGGETPGLAVADLERRLRRSALRDAGASVVDWDPTEPLSESLGRALERR